MNTRSLLDHFRNLGLISGLLAALAAGACSSAGSDASGGAGTGPSAGGGGATNAAGSPGAGQPAGIAGQAAGGAGSGGAPSGSGGQAGKGGGGAQAGNAAGGQAGNAAGGQAGNAAGGQAGNAAGGQAGTKAAVCNFASGVNVAWINFANDVPNPDLAAFNTLFKNTHDAGGRVVRWWFHTNGTVTPGYDSSGKAKPVQQAHIDAVKAILNAANTNGVGLDISLWSFDMLQDNASSAYTNNQLLLENDTNRQAYIDNYLTPLVKGLKGTPGLYSYEIFNEAEGMSEKGWATHRTTEAFIQKTVNWFADAIHAADPQVLVTNGAVTFDYCSNVSGKTNDYSDSALRAAGGRAGGILDYYEVHYYTSNGVSNSPFTHTAASWGLDKKLVMGEFAAQTTDGAVTDDLYTKLYTDGYNGGWAWSYNAPGAGLPAWPSMQTALKNVAAAHTDVGTCH